MSRALSLDLRVRVMSWRRWLTDAQEENRPCQRTGPPGRAGPAPGLVRWSGRARSGPPGVHRRDLGQDRHGPCLPDVAGRGMGRVGFCRRVRPLAGGRGGGRCRAGRRGFRDIGRRSGSSPGDIVRSEHAGETFGLSFASTSPTETMLGPSDSVNLSDSLVTCGQFWNAFPASDNPRSTTEPGVRACRCWWLASCCSLQST